MSDSARIYQLMVLTAWADGHLHALEQRMAGHLLLEVPSLRGLEGRDQLAKEALALLSKAGVRGAVDELASGLDGYAAQRDALTCCARVLAADGRIAVEEFAVISVLRQRFAFSVEDVQRILADATRHAPPA